MSHSSKIDRICRQNVSPGDEFTETYVFRTIISPCRFFSKVLPLIYLIIEQKVMHEKNCGSLFHNSTEYLHAFSDQK